MASILGLEAFSEFIVELMSTAIEESGEESVELESIVNNAKDNIIESVTNGLNVDDAVGEQFVQIQEVNENVANKLIVQLEENGVEYNPNFPESDVGEIDPANPDEYTSPEDLNNKFNVTDDSFQRQSKFKYWISRITGVFSYLGVTGTVILVVAFFLVFGLVYNSACNIYKSIFSSKTVNCTKDSISGNWNCTKPSCKTGFCKTMSNNRKWLQKNSMLAYTAGIALGVLIVSISNGKNLITGLSVTAIVEIAIWAYTGPIGYIISNALCGIDDFFEALKL